MTATKAMVEAGARAIAINCNSPNCSQFDNCSAGDDCACRIDARLAIEAALAAAKAAERGKHLYEVYPGERPALIESWSRSGGAGYTVNTADGIRHLSAFNAGRYTTSIDAALTLVPEGIAADIVAYSNADGRLGDARTWNDQCTIFSTRTMNKRSATPAIALCIAALKARKSAADRESS